LTSCTGSGRTVQWLGQVSIKQVRDVVVIVLTCFYFIFTNNYISLFSCLKKTTGKETKPTIALEAIVDSRLWFWHAFFGCPGSNNDINILDRSPLLVDLMHGRAPEVNFEVNGESFTMGYYLADGIYPDWKVFVKTISAPQGEKKKHYAKRQEGERKDVERGFCALQVSSFLFC